MQVLENWIETFDLKEEKWHELGYFKYLNLNQEKLRSVTKWCWIYNFNI